MSEEIVYGLHAVRALLERRPAAVRCVILQSGRTDKRATELAELARARSIALETRPAAQLDALAGGGVHQGAAARVEAALPLEEHDLLMRLDGAARPPLVLVLDGVQDPHNLGACLRTADGAGADAVVAPRDRAVGLTPVVRKVAAGAAETVPFSQVTNLARFLRALKDAGLWIVGSDGDAQTLHYAADLKGPLAIVLGAEGSGMRRLTREHCDLIVRLPMLGGVESLNVSVAAGVLLYEAVRQRAAAGQP
jgi:23S rRNA (guanosine2251-2'-O)-methyltransferase